MRISTWFNQIGFSSNPFSIKPAAFSDEIFGFEEKADKIVKDAENGDFYVITGDYGNGKTTMMKGILNRLKGKKAIYYNYLKNQKEIDFDELLTGMSIFREVFNAKRKGNILLIDEAQDINKGDIESINTLSEKGFLKSVIFVASDDSNLINSMPNLENNKVDLNRISDKSAIALVRKRIGNLKLLPDKIITKIFAIDKNPRNFLRNCEDICKYAVDNNIKRISQKTISEALK